MSFRDCIQTAIDSGRITAKKGAEAFDSFDRAYAKAKEKGEPDGAAATEAALKTLEDITTLKQEKRWARINEMQRSHEIYTRLMNADDPADELQRIVVDLELSQETVRSFAMANLDRLMLEYKPRAGGLVIPTDNMDDVARAAYGDVRSPEAKEMADSVIETMEMLRLWANRYGAAIPENKNRVLFQTHDQVRVSAVEEDEWVNDHLREGVLDWEVMRYAGKKIDEGEREEILRKTYQGIVNDGFDREAPAQAKRLSLGQRLNRDRFLYYKGAESYIEMQKKYGAGNFYEQTINMVEILAKDISVLKTFGPNADTIKEFTKTTALKRAADLNNLQPAGKKTLVKKMEKQVELFEDEYRIHSWHVVSADGNLAVQSLSTVRTLATSALLGMSFIPNLFGDLANARVARRMFNMPEISVLRSYASEFVPTKEKLAEASRSGVIFENAISLVQTRLRYFGALDGPHWARRIGDGTYRLGLAAHHTQVARNAQGKQVMGLWADYANKAFDDLPFAPLLIENGIKPKDWDRLRAVPLHEFRGAKFLRPIDLYKSASNADKKTAERFSNAMQMYIRTAVPDVTLRSRRAMGEFIDPNSAMGQAVRITTSLLSFPFAIYFNQLQRIAMAPGIRNKLVLGSKYFWWMTMAGAAITQTKALVQGDQLYDMSSLVNEDGSVNTFWGRAVLNGGGFGILGDLIFNNINLSNSRQYQSAPTIEYLHKLHKLTLDNMIDASQTALYERGMLGEPGDELQIGADLQKFIDANIPDLWYTKLIWERAIGDELFAQTDPAGFARRQRYHEENAPQGSWWPAEGEPEALRPETAIGQ